MAKGPNLLDMLGKATEADLSAIDAQIAEKQNELDAACHALEADLASLKQLRKLLDVKLHGKPARKSKQKKRESHDKPDPGESIRAEATHEAALASQIVAAITREGPMTPEVIARKVDRTPQGVRMALTKSAALFRRLGDGRVALPGMKVQDDDD